MKLLTKADLKRYLPAELPFQGRTLKLHHIRRGRTFSFEALTRGRTFGFEALTGKRRFTLRLAPIFVVMYKAENEKFGDFLYIKRRGDLPLIMEEQFRAMYWRLVRRVRS